MKVLVRIGEVVKIIEHDSEEAAAVWLASVEGVEPKVHPYRFEMRPDGGLAIRPIRLRPDSIVTETRVVSGAVEDTPSQPNNP